MKGCLERFDITSKFFDVQLEVALVLRPSVLSESEGDHDKSSKVELH